MADRDDSRDGGSSRGRLPLPADDGDEATRVRMSGQLPVIQKNELTLVGAEPTRRWERADPEEVEEELDDDPLDFEDVPLLLSDDDLVIDDDLPGERTVVDPVVSDRAGGARRTRPPAPPPARARSQRLPGVGPPRDRPAAPAPPSARGPKLPLPAPQRITPSPPPTLTARKHPSADAGGEVGRPTMQGRKRATPRAPVPGRERNEVATAVASDPLAPLDAPLVGGRYRVVERIGQGGMGKVFKVTHAQLGKTFALKVISDNLAEQGKARDLFYREARLASSLSHPNIASVVDFGEDEHLGAFMVMEFLHGEPLNRLLRKDRRLSVKHATELVEQIAEALHYIHQNKIVHCDIKTENILLCEVPGTKRRKQQVKLLDFGLARSTSAGRNTGSLSGTPHYVSPERIRGEPTSPRADIYGLGILYYELLTGKVPWDGVVAQILVGHLEQEPTPPSELIEGGLDPAVEKLILRALAKDPEQRHKDMAAFLYELRTVMDMLGFGRRRGRRSSRRVLVDKGGDKRDELARAVFDASRIPQALIATNGTIVTANPAFAKFVMGVAVDVEGLKVQATPLANAWATFEGDLARACSGDSVRRILELEAGGEIRRLLMWLDPGRADDQAIFGVHPLDT